MNDEIDLHRTNSDGTRDEIFSTSTEIYLRDTYFRSRRLSVLHDEHLEKLQFVFESIKQLTDADEVISGRFIGAYRLHHAATNIHCWPLRNELRVHA